MTAMRSVTYQRLALAALDAVLLAAAWMLSYTLRLGLPMVAVRDDAFIADFTADLRWYAEQMMVVVPWLVGSHLALLWAMGAYKSLWRYMGAREARALAIASVLHAAVWTIFSLWVDGKPQFLDLPLGADASAVLRIPLGIIGIYFFIGLVATSGLRALPRLVTPATRGGESNDAPATLVVGDGNVAEGLLRELGRSPAPRFRPVCIVSRTTDRVGASIHGVPIRGRIEMIPQLLAELHIAAVLVALDNNDPTVLRDVVRACEDARVEFSILPTLSDVAGGRVALDPVRRVKIDDLLGRKPVRIDLPESANYLRGKVVLVTGAGGSIGSELCRQVARAGPAKMVLVGRGENSLHGIASVLSHEARDIAVVTIIADVRDEPAMERLFEEHKPAIIFHAAAHKHVPLMEAQPVEAVRNNVFGTAVVAWLAHRYEAERFFLLSTDKAVSPIGVMGATKRLAEMIIFSLARDSRTHFGAVRFGNVLGSRGSVLDLFSYQIAHNQPVTVTHPEATRYFMTVDEAVSLTLQAGALSSRGGMLYILEMGDPVRIAEMARNMILLSGLTPGRDREVSYIGLRPGEKIHEELVEPRETVRRTAVEKVLSVEPYRIPEWGTLQAALNRLDDVLVIHDRATILEALRDLVPTYHPPELREAGDAERMQQQEKEVSREIHAQSADMLESIDLEAARVTKGAQGDLFAEADSLPAPSSPVEETGSTMAQDDAPEEGEAHDLIELVEPLTPPFPGTTAAPPPPSSVDVGVMEDTPVEGLLALDEKPADAEPGLVHHQAEWESSTLELLGAGDSASEKPVTTSGEEPAPEEEPAIPNPAADFMERLRAAASITEEDAPPASSAIPPIVEVPVGALEAMAEPEAMAAPPLALPGWMSDFAPEPPGDTEARREISIDQAPVTPALAGEPPAPLEEAVPAVLADPLLPLGVAPTEAVGAEPIAEPVAEPAPVGDDQLVDSLFDLSSTARDAEADKPIPLAGLEVETAWAPVVADEEVKIECDPLLPTGEAVASVAAPEDAGAVRVPHVLLAPVSELPSPTEDPSMNPHYADLRAQGRLQRPALPAIPAAADVVLLAFCEGLPADVAAAFLRRLGAVADDKTHLVIAGAQNDMTLPAGVQGRSHWAPNLPVGSALWNAAAKMAPANALLVSVSPDVTPGPDFLDAIREAATKNPDTVLFYAEHDKKTDKGMLRVVLHDHNGCPHERFEFGPVMIYRVAALNQAGGFDETLHHAWEYDMHLRLMQEGFFTRIAKPIYTVADLVVADSKSGALHSPGRGKLGGFSYVFYPPEMEKEVTMVFERALKSVGAWLDNPPALRPEPKVKPPVMASVVIPVLNREKFIGNAIEKVISGTFQDFEVIVIDNGSTDSTRDVVQAIADRDKRIKLMKGTGSSIASALNDGIRAARGKYICQLDSDDEYAPTTLEKMIGHLETHPHCGLAISYYRLMNEHGVIIDDVAPITHSGYSRNQILRRDGGGAVRIFPKAVLEEFGLYDEVHYGNFGEDYDMVLKTGEKYDVDRVHEVLYHYRRHSDNTDVIRDPEMKYHNKNRARQQAIKRRMAINDKLKQG